MTPTNEEILKQAAKEQKRQEKKKQVIAFATGTLGLSGKKAKALRKLGSDYFKLADDGLRFRGAGDRLVAIDSKECTEFFKKKFDYLLTPVSGHGDIRAGRARRRPDRESADERHRTR